MDGNGTQLKNITLTSRDSYGQDTRQNIASSGFWDEVARWVLKQNNAMKFPILGTDVFVLQIAVTATGYIIEADEDTARWQMQLQILYYRKE